MLALIVVVSGSLVAVVAVLLGLVICGGIWLALHGDARQLRMEHGVDDIAAKQLQLAEIVWAQGESFDRSMARLPHPASLYPTLPAQSVRLRH